MRARDLVHRLHLSTRGVEESNVRPVHINPIVQVSIRGARSRWTDEPEAKGIAIEVVTDLEDVPPIIGWVGTLTTKNFIQLRRLWSPE